MNTGESLLAEVVSLRDRLASAELFAARDASANAARLQLMSELEKLKNISCAAQAALAVGVDAAVRAKHADLGLPKAQQGRGVAAQVALARRESPHRGQQFLGLAKDLHTELPATREAMRAGELSEYRATVVARESGCLDSKDRRAVDEALFGPGPDGTPAEALGWGNRQLAAETQRMVCGLDPAAVARRRARAESERNVSLRPAPEFMIHLTATLPLAQGVAAYAALVARAKAARAGGDERSKGQLMADLLVADVTGQSATDGSPSVPVTVDVVISARALLGQNTDPALLIAPGVGATPIDSISARRLIADAIDPNSTDSNSGGARAPDLQPPGAAAMSIQALGEPAAGDHQGDSHHGDPPGSGAWLRRLYADPGGNLVAMSTTARFARGGLADFLRIRDAGLCRTPWCDAPIAEFDHVAPVADGGETSAANLQGLCLACNHAKQAPGWTQHGRRDERGGHVVEITTPSGGHLRSRNRPVSPKRLTA